MIKNKEYYINIYEELVEKDRQRFFEECGDKCGGDDANWDECKADETISTPEEVVGYYLAWNREDALKVWLDRLKRKGHWLSEEDDREVTRILESLLSE